MDKVIYVDFDGTLVDTVKAIVSLYNEDFQFYTDFKYINHNDINTWDFAECECASSTHINTYFNQPRFFDRLEFMPNVYEKLLELYCKGFTINIISMGYTPNLRAKAQWISRHLPFCNFIDVNYKLYPDKSHIDMSDGILIDDSSKNLITSNACVKMCFGEIKSWNEDWNGTRLFNWSNFV